jgi:outer membrane protein assembly factor BamA
MLKRIFSSFLYTCLICSLIPLSGQNLSKTDTSFAEKNKISGHPIVSYTPESSWIFGAALVWVKSNNSKPGVHPSTLNPFAYYTLNKQYSFVTRGEFYSEDAQTNFRLETGKHPDTFYGLGNETGEQYENYTLIVHAIKTKHVRKIVNDLYIGPGIDVKYCKTKNILDNGLLDNSMATGKNGGFLSGFGPIVTYDSRNSAIYPEKGAFADVQFHIFSRHLGSDYKFNRLYIDLRKYYSFGGYTNKANTIAIQGKFDFYHGEKIPFFFLPRVGGETRIRGISANRYLNKHLLMAQIEYRKKLPLRLGFTAFMGLGNVYEKISHLSDDGFKFNTGLGFRYMLLPDEKANFRVDFGIASDGSYAFYIGINEVF